MRHVRFTDEFRKRYADLLVGTAADIQITKAKLGFSSASPLSPQNTMHSTSASQVPINITRSPTKNEVVVLITLAASSTSQQYNEIGLFDSADTLLCHVTFDTVSTSTSRELSMIVTMNPEVYDG